MYRAILVAAVFGLILCEKKITSHTEFSAPRDGNVSLFDYPSSNDLRVTTGTVNTTYATHGKDKGNNQILGKECSTNCTLVNSSDYPYMVDLLESDRHVCGGTIINPMLILTAAHCLEKPLTNVRVTGRDGDTMYPIRKGLKHPSWNPDSQGVHDIALVVLERRIVNAQNVPLQRSSQRIPSYTMAKALSWNMTEHSQKSSQPRLVEVSLTNPFNCKSYFGDTVRLICGIVSFSDSGSPLMYGGRQIGITSVAPTPTPGVHPISGTPTVFTRVSAYYHWVEKVAEAYN